MNEQEYIETIRSLLLKNKKPSYQTTNKKEVRVRCPYCGDSKQDKNHAHMYIQMMPPFKFYCQKCNVAGVLNVQTMHDLDIFSNDLSVSIIQANKNIKKGGTEKINVTKYQTKLNTVIGPYTSQVIDYFNSRYNFNYDNDYLVNKFKAITNASQFLRDNNIPYPKDNYGRPLYDFDRSIGFLSSDGSHVIFRDITGQQAKRYFNLNLFPNDDFSTSNKLYNVRSGLDIMKDQITLVMAEGVFDIIGIYEYFYKSQVDESEYIFAAAAGKGYNAVINHFIRMGLLNLNIIIYSDADVDLEFFRNLKASSPYLKNSPLTIYYNTIEKDYGIPFDQINLRKAIV